MCRMKSVTTKPAIGSAQRWPNATPIRPMSAPSDDITSSHECLASAAMVMEWIRLATRAFVAGNGEVAEHAQDRRQHAHAQVAGPAIGDELLVALVGGEETASQTAAYRRGGRPPVYRAGSRLDKSTEM